MILATKTGVTAGAGKTVSVKFNLTSKARKLFKDSKKRKVIRKNGRKRVKIVKVKGLKQLRLPGPDQRQGFRLPHGEAQRSREVREAKPGSGLAGHAEIEVTCE